jgi:FAD/FMN-containing dehydrogenase
MAACCGASTARPALGIRAGVFGELYPALQALKAAFDPHNQLNPGKIATPANTTRSC